VPHEPSGKHAFDAQSECELHGAQASCLQTGAVPVHAPGSVAVHATQAFVVVSQTAVPALQSPSEPQPLGGVSLAGPLASISAQLLSGFAPGQ